MTGNWKIGAQLSTSHSSIAALDPSQMLETVERGREAVILHVFLAKIRFPSPANGLDEGLSCFCGHCRREAKAVDLDLDAVVRMLADGAIEAPSFSDGSRAEAQSWLETIASANPILSRFLKFR